MCWTRKFYIADTHFSHTNIISHCSRPYQSAEDMDEDMVRRWNAVVRPDDVIYHLGDFSFELGNAKRVRDIFSRLNGRKHLVLGNHDVVRDGAVHPTIAGLAWAVPPTYALETRDGGQRVYLSHYAHRVWPAHHHGAWHFYGHSHGGLPSLGRSRDVGVDMPDVRFQPRTFAELTKGME